MNEIIYPRMSVIKNRIDYTANCYINQNYYSACGKSGPEAIRKLRELVNSPEKIAAYDKSVGRK